MPKHEPLQNLFFTCTLKFSGFQTNRIRALAPFLIIITAKVCIFFEIKKWIKTEKLKSKN